MRELIKKSRSTIRTLLVVSFLLWPSLTLKAQEIRIIGDLEGLLQQGETFIFVINPRTGNMAVASRDFLHAELVERVGASSRTGIVRGFFFKEGDTWIMDFQNLEGYQGPRASEPPLFVKQWQHPNMEGSVRRHAERLRNSADAEPLLTRARAQGGQGVRLTLSRREVPGARLIVSGGPRGGGSRGGNSGDSGDGTDGNKPPDDNKPPSDDGSDDKAKGSFEDELEKKSSTSAPSTKTNVRKLETKNKLLQEIISERTPPELKRVGTAGEYVVLFDLNEEMLSGKVQERFNLDYLRANFPEVPEAQRAAVLQKLVNDRLFELQKARGAALWGQGPNVDALAPEERAAVVKTRAFLETLKDKLKPFDSPDVGFLQSLRQMSAGEAGVLFGPILVDAAVAWYDQGWQAGLVTIGIQGSTALGVMLIASYSPLVATGLHAFMTFYWPVIVFHVVKGGVYVAGSLFEDYLIRDNMVRILYLEPGATVRGLGLPAGTKLSGFFDSSYGQGLTRTTLHTKYQTKTNVAAAIDGYRAWLQDQPEAATGPVFYALRDTRDAQVIWQRIKDRAKADWFESMAKELEAAFKPAERESKTALFKVEGRAEALRSLAQKDYVGAQGFVLDVRYNPEQPKVNEPVTIEVIYAVAGAVGEKVTANLPVVISGPGANKTEKLLDQKVFSFDEDHPLIVGRERTTMTVPMDGNYQVSARLELDKGIPGSLQSAFATPDCTPAAQGPLARLRAAFQTARNAADRVKSARAQAAEIDEQAKNIAQEIKELRRGSSTLNEDCTKAATSVQEIQRIRAALDGSGVKISELRKTAEALAVVTCELADKAKQAGDPTKATNFAYNSGQFAKQARKKADEASDGANSARRFYHSLMQKLGEVEPLYKRVGELRSNFGLLLDKVQDQKDRIGALTASEATSQMATMDGAMADAEKLLAIIRPLLQPCSNAPSAQALLADSGRLHEAIRDVRNQAIAAYAEFQAISQRATAQLASAEALANGLQQALASCDNLKTDAGVADDMKAALDTIDVFAQAAAEFAKKAEDCAAQRTGPSDRQNPPTTDEVPPSVRDTRQVNDPGFMSGSCSGTISASPTSGYVHSPFVMTITISPPFDKVITRVTTNNPGCTTCDATQARPGQFSRTLYFTGKPGSFTVEFLAFDKDGKVRCRGNTTSLTVLGSR
jgi:hypothetical protein